MGIIGPACSAQSEVGASQCSVAIVTFIISSGTALQVVHCKNILRQGGKRGSMREGASQEKQEQRTSYRYDLQCTIMFFLCLQFDFDKWENVRPFVYCAVRSVLCSRSIRMPSTFHQRGAK
jgi:hypothetical protein